MKTLVVCFFILGFSSSAFAVSFEKEILPIFQDRCFRCHGEGESKGGLSLEADKINRHIRSSKQINPGNADRSVLMDMLTTDDGDERMPRRGGPLSAPQIELIKKWIDEGAKLDASEPSPDDPVATKEERKPLAATWTNRAGKAIQATLLRVEGEKAVLQVAGGKIYNVPLSTLSDESQAKIRDWMKGLTAEDGEEEEAIR